jgi:hypothetical protein
LSFSETEPVSREETTKLGKPLGFGHGAPVADIAARTGRGELAAHKGEKARPSASHGFPVLQEGFFSCLPSLDGPA